MPDSQPLKNYTIIVIVLIIAVACGGFFLWKTLTGKSKQNLTPKNIQPVAIPTPAISVARTEPVTESTPIIVAPPVEPVTTPSPSPTPTPAVPLPQLNESDEFINEQLAPLADSTLLSLIVPDELVRKLVRAIIGVSDNKLVNQYRPIVSPLPPLGIEQTGSLQAPQYRLTEKNYERYNSYVAWLDTISPTTLATLYHTLEPLFEQAYAEQGLGGSFKPVILKAIDNLLQTPAIDGPLRLVRPAVMYRFADPQLELLSDPQKLLIRMGPTHSTKIRTFLTALKEQL